MIPLLTLTAIDPHRCDISLPNSNSTGDLYSHLFLDCHFTKAPIAAT